MAAGHRHPDRGGRDLHLFIIEDLARLVHQLHLLLCISVIKKDIAVRQAVHIDGMGIHLRALDPFALILQLVDSRFARTCNRLIGGDHDPFDPELPVQGRQHHDHLDGGTVGVGNDPVFPGKDVAVDLRHDQGDIRVHAPGRRVVDHCRTPRSKCRSIFPGHISSGRKKSDVRLYVHRFLHFHNSDLPVPE